MSTSGVRATDAVAARIAAFRQQSRVRAGSLIISIFGDAVLPRGGRLWIGSLIRLLEPLGISERLTRTSVFRLAREGWLRIESHGRRADYLLTPAGQRRFEAASRAIYAGQPRAWDGRWRLMLLVGEIDGKLREQLRRALAWQGFGAIGPHCFVHPGANLDEVLHALATEGLAGHRDHLMPLLASDARYGLGANDAELVRSAWSLGALAQDYAEFDDRYQPLLDALQASRAAPAPAAMPAAIDDEHAFLLRTLLIHDWRRLLLRDPELPDMLLPADWPGQRARRLTQTLYRSLLPASERHLDAHLLRADGTPLRAGAGLEARFQGAAAAAGTPQALDSTA